MDFLVLLAEGFAFSIIMIVLCFIAMLVRSKKAGWVLYIIATAIQAFMLVGFIVTSYGSMDAFYVCCGFFVVLSILTILVISVRKREIKTSVSDYEDAYKRIAKFHKYVEQGAMSEEEFEKVRQEILSGLK